MAVSPIPHVPVACECQGRLGPGCGALLWVLSVLAVCEDQNAHSAGGVGALAHPGARWGGLCISQGPQRRQGTRHLRVTMVMILERWTGGCLQWPGGQVKLPEPLLWSGCMGECPSSDWKLRSPFLGSQKGRSALVLSHMGRVKGELPQAGLTHDGRVPGVPFASPTLS